MAKKYGIFREGPPLPGISERAVIIIDKNGVIAFRKVYDLSDAPDLDELLSALRKLEQRSGRTEKQAAR